MPWAVAGPSGTADRTPHSGKTDSHPAAGRAIREDLIQRGRPYFWGTRTARHMVSREMGKLAIDGGTPVRTKPFPGWPRYDEAERRGLLRALERGMWGGRMARGSGE